MANRKSASKQAVEGASRSPKPQPANKNRSVNPGKAPSKPPTSSSQPSNSKPQNRKSSTTPPLARSTANSLGIAPKPPQPQLAMNRSSNGTRCAGNGSPISQGAIGPTRDRSMHQTAPKRGNGPQRARGHVPVPQPNVSLKLQAPKPGPNSVRHRHTQKAPNQTPTLQMSQTRQQPTNSKSNGSPKVPTSTQHTLRGGHKDNIPSSTPNKTPLPTKRTPLPPPAKASPPISSAGLKGTGKQSYNLMNSSGLTLNSSKQANIAKGTPVVKGSGLLGWLSSWWPSSGLVPVQVTKTSEMPNPRTHQIDRANSSTSANVGLTNIPKKNPPAIKKVQPESRHAQATNKRGNNNNVSAKRSSLSLRWSESSTIPFKKDILPASKKMSPSVSTNSKGTPRKFPVNKRIQITKQSHGVTHKPSASVRQVVSKSSKGLRSGKLNTSVLSRMRTYATLPKEQASDRSEGTSKLARGDANLLQVVSRHAKESSKHQSVRGSSGTIEVAKYTSVPRKKEFRVRSSSSNVLSRAPTKTLRKGLLRQYSPTLVWRSSDTPKIVSAYSTLAALPLPSVPKNELRNKAACKTISQNPGLFKITTPIKVDAFEKYLKGHPNQSFVKSVVRALRKGFWPWANTNDPTFPTTYDGSRQRQLITSKDKSNFIQQQRNEEVTLGRWSKPFGKRLLPGMYSSPIGAVPKSTPGKYRLVIDQSSGPHALNSLIPKSQVKVKLDNIHDLGTALLAVRKKYPKRKITLFKSDVKSAYRQLPVHPSWQIKQIVSINGQRYVDRCNTFGSRGGGWNWNAFASLVNWIGTEKKNIPGLLGYVDDNFGWDFEGNTKYYRPYKKHLPAKQTRLLKLWDELGIPHDEEKQLTGPCLPILGYEVDANAMTVKVPDQKKAKVVRLLRTYSRQGTSYTLKELQSVAGSVNPVLCLYPRLRSGLRGLFDEMAGKERPSTKLKVTKSAARSLLKLADYLEHAPPVPIRQKN